MKKLAIIPILIAILLFLSCCTNSSLTEKKALKTVDSVLAKGVELLDNSPNPAYLLEWQGLLKISETEMHGRAIIQHKDGRMGGQFIFHIDANNRWILDEVYFRGLGGRWSGWNEKVFQKVE
ncbi:MAG: hypothetical protein A2W85_05145 [Bacteroidetes bacterium GWF2_41_31]|nr:MAG: hypothetical protein A2W85_05145 [Bacteroidetes bacterium GWF2_41_31]